MLLLYLVENTLVHWCNNGEHLEEQLDEFYSVKLLTGESIKKM